MYPTIPLVSLQPVNPWSYEAGRLRAAPFDATPEGQRDREIVWEMAKHLDRLAALLPDVQVADNVASLALARLATDKTILPHAVALLRHLTGDGAGEAPAGASAEQLAQLEARSRADAEKRAEAETRLAQVEVQLEQLTTKLLAATGRAQTAEEDAQEARDALEGAQEEARAAVKTAARLEREHAEQLARLATPDRKASKAAAKDGAKDGAKKTAARRSRKRAASKAAPAAPAAAEQAAAPEATPAPETAPVPEPVNGVGTSEDTAAPEDTAAVA